MLRELLRKFGFGKIYKPLVEPAVNRSSLGQLIRHTGNFADSTWSGYPICQNTLDPGTIREAIVEAKSASVLDQERCERFLITHHPMGWLRRK